METLKPELDRDGMDRGKSIAIVGVYPPPYGGISVHIERLYHALKARGIACKVYNGSEPSSTDKSHSDQNADGHIKIGKVSRNTDEKNGTALENNDVVPISNIEQWCWRYLLQNNEDIIHNHFLRWQVRFILSLLKLKGKRVIHSIHSYRNEDLYSKPIRWMIRLTGWLSDHFVVVNGDIKEKLVGLGISEKKITVIPPFIPPAEQNTIKMPNYIDDFFRRHDKVILANGGVGNIYKGNELYGLDLCIDLMEQLCAKRSVREISDEGLSETGLFDGEHSEAGLTDAGLPGGAPTDCELSDTGLPGAELSDGELSDTGLSGAELSDAERFNVGLVYCITHVVDDNKLRELKTQISRLGLDEHILLVQEKMPLYPLMQKSALFVRPTSSDGDAISIREAIYYRIPVVASDAVNRPLGTVLFENRNAEDFAQKCNMLLANPASSTVQPPEDQSIYLQQLIGILTK